MDDLISRQAAIDAIHCDITITGRQNAELVAATIGAIIGAFADRIKALPPAQPKRGKWVDMGKDPATGKWDTRLHIYCSECGHRSDDKPTKYCPNCGAKMEAADGND